MAKPPPGKRELNADSASLQPRVPSNPHINRQRPKLARVNPIPRTQNKTLTPRQKRFIREYLIDMSPADAYMRSGYEVESRQSAYTLACRLMKNPHILEAIDQIQGGLLNRLEIDIEWVVLRFKLLYLKAIGDNDLSTACVALRNIGQHLGLYEKDNKQRQQQYSQSDLDRLQKELEEAGMDFTRVNFSQQTILNAEIERTQHQIDEREHKMDHKPNANGDGKK